MLSLSVIIPAYNEAGNLPSTFREVVPIIEKFFTDYEIFIFDDCSTDDTGKIADEAAQKNSKIKVIHNEKNMGLGYNYKTGLKMAAKEYYIMIPGDNDITPASYEVVFEAMKKGTDMVIPYTSNMEIRPFARQVISNTYTFLLNLLFGMNLQYFNGTVVHKTSVLRSISIETDGFAYQAEALLKLVKLQKHSYVEVPIKLGERAYGKSKAFNLRNVYRVFKSIFDLWLNVRILGKS